MMVHQWTFFLFVQQLHLVQSSLNIFQKTEEITINNGVYYIENIQNGLSIQINEWFVSRHEMNDFMRFEKAPNAHRIRMH